MSKSRRPGLHELRDIYLLLGECCELGADPQAWQHHLLVRFNQILGARFSASKFMRAPEGSTPRVIDWVGAGLDGDSDWKVFQRYWQEHAYDQDPINQPANRQLLYGPGRVVWRTMLVEDRQWYVSPVFNEYYRDQRVDDSIAMCTQAGPDLWHHASFHRCLSDGSFEVRHIRLLFLFRLELRLRLGTRLALPCATPPVRLSPRLCQVLGLLVHGDSEKQVAHRLGLSAYTVHDYVKALHKHFGVASRGELLARAHALGRTAVGGVDQTFVQNSRVV